MDREIVIPWLRFLWDTYRTVLDTLRYVNKLELLYKSTAEQAFQFCLHHRRVVEFRRLNELLKAHMSFLKTTSVSQLDNPESFQIQLEIRLMQLNTAAAMELWQEAFRTVEEINGMVSPPKRTPPIEMMIVYYEKLAKIFWVSENYIFHAHALSKYHQLLAELKAVQQQSETGTGSKISLPEVVESELATQVLLAALSMPVAPGVNTHRSIQVKASRQHVPLSVALAIEKQQNLNIDVATNHLLSDSESNMQERLAKASAIHGFSDLEPNRDVVLREILSMDLMANILPQFADLYDMLESKFHPLKLGKLIQEKIAALEAVPSLKQYAKTITQLAFLRIIQQLGSVYQTMRLQKLIELVPFVPKEMIEKWTVRAIRERYIEAKLDHKHGYIIFQTSLGGAQQAANPQVAAASGSLAVSTAGSTVGTSSSFESERVRHQMVHIARNLSLAVSAVIAPSREAHNAQRKAIFASVAAEMESERGRILKRREIIERTNLEREKRTVLAAKERALREREARERAQQEERERQEAKRLAAVEKAAAAKRAELEAQQQTALMGKLQETAAKQGAALDEKAAEKLKGGKMDKQEFIDSQVKLIVATQQRTESKLRDLVEKADHLARAKREAELPLMKAAAAERVAKEGAQMKSLKEKRIEEARKQYEKIAADKKRLEKFQAERKKYEEKILAERRQAWLKAEVDRKGKEEVAAKRREEERAKQEEADRKRQAAEAERRAQEESKRKERETKEAEETAAAEATASKAAAAADGESKLTWAQKKALESGGSIQRPAGGAASGGSYRPPGARDGGSGGSAYRPPSARSETSYAAADSGASGDSGSWKRQGGQGGSSSTSTTKEDDSGTWKRQGGSAPRSATTAAGAGSGGSQPTAGSTGGAYKPPARRGGDRW